MITEKENTRQSIKLKNVYSSKKDKILQHGMIKNVVLLFKLIVLTEHFQNQSIKDLVSKTRDWVCG